MVVPASTPSGLRKKLLINRRDGQQIRLVVNGVEVWITVTVGTKRSGIDVLFYAPHEASIVRGELVHAMARAREQHEGHGAEVPQ